VRKLSKSQKDAIKATLTPTLTGSHTALAQLGSNLMAEHHLSYAALRDLMDGRLPDNLATPSALKRRKKPTPRSLTTDAPDQDGATFLREWLGDLEEVEEAGEYVSILRFPPPDQIPNSERP
jgi:hypothetical protein